jgi:hypothetical protein
MGYKKVYVGRGEECLLVDSDSGALLVNAVGMTVNADVITVDVAAIVDGIAGAGAAAKTLADVVTKLGGLSAAANAADYATGTGNNQTLCAANAARKTAIITNLSLTAILWIALGATAAAGKGIPLAPAADATHPGGTLTVSGADYTGAISGITSDTTAHNVALAEI